MRKVTYNNYTVNPDGGKKWGRGKGLICNKYEHGSCLMGFCFLHRRTPTQSGKLALVVEAGG